MQRVPPERHADKSKDALASAVARNASFGGFSNSVRHTIL